MSSLPVTDNLRIYTIRRVAEVRPAAEEAPPGDAVRIDADCYGNVIFKALKRYPRTKSKRG